MEMGKGGSGTSGPTMSGRDWRKLSVRIGACGRSVISAVSIYSRVSVRDTSGSYS